MPLLLRRWHLQHCHLQNLCIYHLLEDKSRLTAEITQSSLAIAKQKHGLVKLLDHVFKVHLLDRNRVIFRVRCAYSPKSRAHSF